MGDEYTQEHLLEALIWSQGKLEGYYKKLNKGDNNMPSKERALKTIISVLKKELP